MKGKIIQIMGPTVNVEFDGYLFDFDDCFELVLETLKHITNIIINMAIVWDLVFKVEIRIRGPTII